MCQHHKECEKFVLVIITILVVGAFIGLGYLAIYYGRPAPIPQLEIGRYIQLGGTPLVLDTATGKVCDPRMYDNQHIYPICTYDTLITHQVGRYQQFGMGVIVIDTATGKLIDTYTQPGKQQ